MSQLSKNTLTDFLRLIFRELFQFKPQLLLLGHLVYIRKTLSIFSVGAYININLISYDILKFNLLGGGEGLRSPDQQNLS